jgi:hypothetical protein
LNGDTIRRWSDSVGIWRCSNRFFEIAPPPINPLVAITPIVDHLPKIMAVTGLGALDLDELQNTPLAQPGVMVDYLKTYVVDGHLDVPRLFNDDYFEAIKLLYNARHWVSAAKLLMSFLIPLRLLTWATWQATSRYGWTNTLISAPSASLRKELWEYRNGLSTHPRAGCFAKFCRSAILPITTRNEL